MDLESEVVAQSVATYMDLKEVMKPEKKEGRNTPGSEHSRSKGPGAERESWEPVGREQDLLGPGKCVNFMPDAMGSF